MLTLKTINYRVNNVNTNNEFDGVDAMHNETCSIYTMDCACQFLVTKTHHRVRFLSIIEQ